MAEDNQSISQAQSEQSKEEQPISVKHSSTTGTLAHEFNAVGSNDNKPMLKTLVNDVNSSSRPENPMSKASIISRLFYMWPYPLLKLGMERPLEDQDLPHIPDQDTSSTNRLHLERIWRDEIRRCNNKKQKPSLHRALLIDFFKDMWFIQVMMVAALTAKVVQAVALGMLIETFENSESGNEGYMWAGILVACGLVILFEHHHVFFFTWRKGMQYRVASVAAIYHKSLKLSSTHQDTSTSSGKIMNLASNDVERYLLACLFMSHLIWSPVQSIAILGLGCYLIGPAAFSAGFGLLVVVFVPLQMYLSGKFSVYRSKVAALTDKRVNFVSQATSGARVMKMSGFEYRFLERIQALRQQEVSQIVRANNLKAINEALFFSANVVISIVVFVVHVFTGGTLTPGDVFTVFTLINVLQVEMTKHVSLGVMGVSEVFVSIKRIQNFLEFPEIPSVATNDYNKKNHTELEQDRSNADVAISLSDVTCYWNDVVHPLHDTATAKSDSENENEEDDEDSKFLALSDVTCRCHKGELVCVIGSVGSGKSALLQAMVGELPIHKGTVQRTYTTLAYAAQDPWIMNGSVKENIIMGHDPKCDNKDEWYHSVVEACGLLVDFKQFRDGENTIVGDRGIQISGGQRARIGLARAIYLDADILVADDPLSAVDAKVGRQLFRDALMGLMVSRGKCVVLATHQHQYLSGDEGEEDKQKNTKCVLMDTGAIACIGTYEECVAQSKGKLISQNSFGSLSELVDKDEETEKKTTFTTNTKISQISEKQSDTTAEKADDKTPEKKEEEGKEMNEQGMVRLDTYKNYVKAMGGYWVGFFFFFMYCITQASSLYTITTVGRWAERPKEEQDSWDIIGLVIGLGLLVMMLSLCRAMMSLRLCLLASKRLHDTMAYSVLRAKMEFFDTNPLGRILNRFSADVGSNDDLLPTTMFDFFVVAFIVLGAIVVTILTLPFTLISVPPLLCYFIYVRRVFVTSTRELKRLEGLARSPIFAMLNESLGGIATIRANNALGYFSKKFEDVHDSHTRAFFAFISSSRWVGIRMDGIMFCFMALVSFLAVLFNQQAWFQIDPAVLGLSISMLLQLSGLFQWCIRQSAEVVNQMVSVERVLGYGSLESEADLEKKDVDTNLQASNWPTKGRVCMQNLSVRYRPNLPLALENVSLTVPGGTRVGIVGRTGSGKSTIVQTFFRLLEADGGSMSFDNVDISTVGLHTLRTNISVIPQVPTLFSGCTVRENLDLFGLHSDEAIWEALMDSHMAEVIRKLPHGWDSLVSEGGSNFSVGQRQLLCLARAILCKNKILILDEATASVDRRTDEMLQDALQRKFQHATIFAVAHRLETIIDYDLILVLGHGKVLEFGSPKDLISRQGGAFANMVRDTGDAMSADLRRRALEKS